MLLLFIWGCASDGVYVPCNLHACQLGQSKSGPPFETEERQLGWQCCTESATSLPLMELRTSSTPTSTMKTQPAVLAAILQNPVPAVYSFLPRTTRDWNKLPRMSLRPRPSIYKNKKMRCWPSLKWQNNQHDDGGRFTRRRRRRVTVGDSGLCCCTCVTYFEC